MQRSALPLFLLITLSSSAQQYLGVRTWGGSDADQVNALAVDVQDRVYALGGFRGTADMDPGQGNAPFSTAGGDQDIFLSRFAADGQWEWSRQLGGPMHDNAQALAVNGHSVFVGGEFRDTMGTSLGDLISQGSADALLARYGPDGNLLWAFGLGSTGNDFINDVAVDTAGNVYAIGYFQGTVDFDPGPQLYPVSAVGGDAMFLWKVSAAGELVWVRTWSGTSSENGLAVAVGPTNDVWIGGAYYGTLDLDPDAGTTMVSASGFEEDAFLVHLDADGAFLFGGDMGGTGSDAVVDLRVEPQGEVIAAGGFTDTGDFDPGPGTTTLQHVGGPDSFVLIVSAAGDLLRAAVIAGASYDQPRAVEVGPHGDIMMSGSFDGTIDLDPGAPTAMFLCNGVSDVYVVLLDSALNYVEGATWGGTGTEDGNSLCWSATDRRYVGGLFEYVVDFDPGAGIDDVSSILNSRDAFITRLCSPKTVQHEVTIATGDSLFVGEAWQVESGTYTDTYTALSGCDSMVVTLLTVETNTAVDEARVIPGLHVFPNPALDVLTIALSAPAPGTWSAIYDATGRLVQRTSLTQSLVNTLSVAALAPGTYVVRLNDAVGTRAVFVKE